MTKLSVNLNAVAHLRNRRDVGWPDVGNIANIVLDAGAHGVTVHPRPDERHIRRTDVFTLAELVTGRPGTEFNIEGYPTEDFLTLVETAKPHQVTLVPDDPAQNTSDHGWDVRTHMDQLKPIIARMKAAGIRVSLFIDEDPAMVDAAVEAGTDRVELYTGPYGATFGTDEGKGHLAALAETARAAHAAGLGINAGHDLVLDNLEEFSRNVRPVDEASIGHGLTADALIMGFAEAVKRYVAILEGAGR